MITCHSSENYLFQVKCVDEGEKAKKALCASYRGLVSAASCVDLTKNCKKALLLSGTQCYKATLETLRNRMAGRLTRVERRKNVAQDRDCTISRQSFLSYYR